MNRAERRVVIVIAIMSVPIFVVVTGMWSPHRWGMYHDAMRERADIRFYGRVVDEADQPLENVKVQVRIAKGNWAYILGAESAYSEPSFARTTDAQGRFSVENISGLALYVDRLDKAGYMFKHSRNEGAYSYAGAGANPAHKPDPKKPVNFKMLTEESYRRERAEEAQLRKETRDRQRFDREQKRRSPTSREG